MQEAALLSLLLQLLPLLLPLLLLLRLLLLHQLFLQHPMSCCHVAGWAVRSLLPPVRGAPGSDSALSQHRTGIQERVCPLLLLPLLVLVLVLVLALAAMLL